MRIALDATYSVDPYPSGIANYSRELLSGLAAMYRDHQFVHCYRPKQRLKAHASSYTNVQTRLLLPPLRTFRADVYHALNQRVDRRASRIVISTFHDLFVMSGDYSTPEFRARFTSQAKASARRSDLIIAVSEFTASQVVELLGVERSRIRVVPHGVCQPRAAVASAREKMILFVGALQARKNVLRLVEAMESLPSDWTLVLAGSPNGFQADRILHAISKSKCRNQITVTGFISPNELERLYAAASIFAFPSLDEGFGIPVLEAMIHEVPVVTANRSALAEIAGGAALLVNPQSTDEIAKAIRRLIEDAPLREDLIARGIAHASEYTWQRAVVETWKVYEETWR